MKNTHHTLTENQIPLLLSMLEEGQTLSISPQGDSMFPFFLGNRDILNIQPVAHPLKRGDIALYQRRNGIYVVHRVHHVTKAPSHSSIEESAHTSYHYYMVGDHQTWIEGPIKDAHVYGVVSSIERKGIHIDCSHSKKYTLAWNIWLLVRPMRPILYPLLIKMNALRHKKTRSL